VSTFKTKKAKRQRDRVLRQEISQILKNNNCPDSVADLLSNWEPYDPNFVATFFDAEWMFGIKDGFDVVIGNPPYVFARNSKEKGFTKESKAYFYKNYTLAEYQVNLYPLFIEMGCNILKNNGYLAYITPNNWMTINTNKNVRKFILEKSNIQIVNFLAQVFESVAVDNSIIIFSKSKSNSNIKMMEYIETFDVIKELDAGYFLQQQDYLMNIDILRNDSVIQLLTKVEICSITLKDIASIKVGLGAYGFERGIPPQTREMINSRIYHSKIRETSEYFKYLEGSDVCRYLLGWSGEYLKYGSNLREPRNNFDLFSTPRILVRQIPSQPPYCINACFTKETILNDRNSMNIIDIKIESELVLGILNSRLISYWLFINLVSFNEVFSHSLKLMN
jgi:hypothetical protein